MSPNKFIETLTHALSNVCTGVFLYYYSINVIALITSESECKRYYIKKLFLKIFIQLCLVFYTLLLNFKFKTLCSLLFMVLFYVIHKR